MQPCWWNLVGLTTSWIVWRIDRIHLLGTHTHIWHMYSCDVITYAYKLLHICEHVHEINPFVLCKTRYESLLEDVTLRWPLHWSSSSVMCTELYWSSTVVYDWRFYHGKFSVIRRLYWLSLHFSKGKWKCIVCVASCLHGGVFNWCTFILVRL